MLFSGTREHQSTLAVSTKILTGIETEDAEIGQVADPPVSVLGAMRLGRVLDHDQPVATGDFQDRIHVGGMPVEVHRQDGAGAPGDGLFDPRRIKRVGVRRDIDKHRRCTGIADGGHAGDKRVRRGDDFVTRADSGGEHG